MLQRCFRAFPAVLLPAALAQQTAYLDEDFDAGIPATWTVVDVACPNTNWHSTTGGYSGSTLDGTEFAFIDSDAAGEFCQVEDYLVSPVFDASGATDLWLTFDHYYRHYVTDQGTVQVFDGSAWVDVATYDTSTGTWDAPDRAEIDVTALASAAMQVRFKYTGNWDWWWAVDNVAVKGTGCPAERHCSPGPTGNQQTEIQLDTCSLVAEVRLSIVDLPGGIDTNGQFAYLLVSDGNDVAQQPPGSNGDLCLVGGSGIGRYVEDVGAIPLTTNLAVNDTAPGNGVPFFGGTYLPGETWHFQYWHRQPSQPSNFSDAISVQFLQ